MERVKRSAEIGGHMKPGALKILKPKAKRIWAAKILPSRRFKVRQVWQITYRFVWVGP